MCTELPLAACWEPAWQSRFQGETAVGEGGKRKGGEGGKDEQPPSGALHYSQGQGGPQRESSRQGLPAGQAELRPWLPSVSPTCPPARLLAPHLGSPSCLGAGDDVGLGPVSLPPGGETFCTQPPAPTPGCPCLSWVNTPEQLLPPLLLSSSHSLPRTLFHSTLGYVQAEAWAVCHSAIQARDSQFVFLWEGQPSATRVGGQACAPYSEWRLGRTASLGPSQDTCPRRLPLHQPL